ncbi:hypothetical protein [Spiroplasma sp. BIUS-1]|uniref:hypothetical protein n=1 Tax=Spiroplasma sp. BIUS-1 TaxID=216964 RepID=UPI0013983AAC|nr:hypothetical protein [Spiroplasma sp. BIUS-1]QHX36650.1 hypothetical protein SBIUS_v1c03970 [Spiroplasma sp. BIUS-1]
MKIAAFNVIGFIDKSDLNDFNNSVEFFKEKGFNVITPENKIENNKEESLKLDFERIMERKPFLSLPTFCKKDDINFIKKVKWKKVTKSQTIFCGNSFVTPFLNAILKFTPNTVLYGPNFISNFNLDTKETLYVNLVQKATMQNSSSELELIDPRYFGKKIVKGNLVGGEITSFLELYQTGYISKVTKKDVLLIDGIFENREDIEEVIEKLNKFKILKKAKAILICESMMENQEVLENFLQGFKNIKKANVVVGLRGMLSEEIDILKLNQEIKIDFKNNKVFQ